MTRKMYRFDKETGECVEMTPRQTEHYHFVRDDTVEPFVSHATDEGLVFDSMSKYKEHLAEHNMEITGGDHLTGRHLHNTPLYKANREEINADVQRAINARKYGMVPMSEKEKHQCQMEQRKFEQEAKRAKGGWLPNPANDPNRR